MIEIKKTSEKAGHVYENGDLVGRVAGNSCGTDFMPHGSRGRFLIKVNIWNEERLIKCLEAIMTLKIPTGLFMYGFSYKSLEEPNGMAEYAKRVKMELLTPTE